MERYEWVVIRHPELASSIKTQEQLEPSPADGQNTENNGLKQPEKPAGDISPFLSARHFNLNSKNTSMFMAGSVDSIIVGEWAADARPTQTMSFYHWLMGNVCLCWCPGGGEGNALYIDSELNHGRAGRCTTFDNPPLCAETFQVGLLEVWGFQDAMNS